MIPGSVVALISQLLSLSVRTTAVISVYAILVLTTWIHRSWISATIPTPIVIFVMITSGLVSAIIPRPAATVQNNLSHSGIVDFGEKANDWAIPKVPLFAADSKHDVWYVAVDFHISSSQHQDLVLKLLGAGVNVRFLFYDFLGERPQDVNPNFQDLVKRFDYQSPQLIADLTSTAENLRKLQSRWTNTPSGAKLEIRLYRALPWARAYLFDPSQENGKALIVNYIYGKDTSNLPALLLKNEPGGMLQNYYIGVQALWQDATDFHEWLIKYDAYKAHNSKTSSEDIKP